MRRIVVVFSSTITALVLLMAWPTSTNRGGTSLASLASGSGSGSGTGTTTGAAAPAPAAAPPAAAAKSGTTTATKKGKDGTFTGQTADTPYGPVQVKITVTGGKFSDVNAIVLPHGNSYDEQVDQYAVPVLAKEAVSSQSAKIQMVSGATYTSTGYLQSLQSALDQAGL
jgi:uncharacterized protein with FMN-binding domain